MDFGSKLEGLHLTRDEMKRFGEALKDDRFRELLSEYAAEISNPENKRRYEQEIARLEEDRGMTVRFLHPETHHVLKTRSAGGKCFINICCDPLIDTPSCEAARDRDGKPGRDWRLPFSLTPGRPDRDAAGKPCMVYDAVFHPDALREASNNARFMDLVHRTAVGGIRDSFHVELDEDKIKRLKMKYKGVPHPAVIRKPIPGHIQKQKPREELLTFPYPDEPRTSAEPDAEDTTSPSPQQPIKPHYTLKYRSVVDLQDYRCSRDSGPGARPTEIVVIVDVPLLRSAQDADVRVEERRLVLESQKPAYKLDLPLSYPVDEDKGDAKFNKTKKQLMITLPVRPSKNPDQHLIGHDETNVTSVEEKHKNSHLTEEEVLEAESNGDVLTAGLASGNRFVVLQTEPQMHEARSSIIATATETQEPDLHARTAEMTITSSVLHSSSNIKFVSESKSPNGADEDIRHTCCSPQTDNKEALESNTEPPPSCPHDPSVTDSNAATRRQTCSSETARDVNPLLKQEEDLNSSQETTKHDTKRSSEDQETEDAAADSKPLRAGPREIHPPCSHRTSTALAFNNSLRFNLD